MSVIQNIVDFWVSFYLVITTYISLIKRKFIYYVKFMIILIKLICVKTFVNFKSKFLLFLKIFCLLMLFYSCIRDNRRFLQLSLCL